MYTVPLLAFALSVLLHILAMRYFPKIGLLDFPLRYGHIRKSIPYPMGVLSVCTFLIVFVYTAPISLQSGGIILGVSLLALVSFIDDRIDVHPVVRLCIQILVACIIFATGSQVYTLTNPLLADGLMNLDSWDIVVQHPLSFVQYPLVLPVWSGVFTIFWLMLTMNALNWFDGIPGQVSTLSAIGFVVIGCLSLSSRVNQPDVALLAFTLGAIAVAALIFDFPPAKGLMGDTGAMFFGLMLGVLTIYSGGKVATAFLVLGVPLIDVFIVITYRIFKKKNPLQGNKTNEHLHHRLQSIGWSERQIIALTASIGTLFGVTALFASTLQKIGAAGVLFLLMLGMNMYTQQKGASRG